MPYYLPPNPKNKKKPYTCPKCQADIRLVTNFTGWDREEIDPETGEWVEDSDTYTERMDIHDVEWSCTRCEWEGATNKIEDYD